MAPSQVSAAKARKAAKDKGQEGGYEGCGKAAERAASVPPSEAAPLRRDVIASTAGRRLDLPYGVVIPVKINIIGIVVIFHM